jgi:hypothetical protein
MLKENDHRAISLLFKSKIAGYYHWDFDRNMDQWKWATSDTVKENYITRSPATGTRPFFILMACY